MKESPQLEPSFYSSVLTETETACLDMIFFSSFLHVKSNTKIQFNRFMVHRTLLVISSDKADINAKPEDEVI